MVDYHNREENLKKKTEFMIECPIIRDHPKSQPQKPLRINRNVITPRKDYEANRGPLNPRDDDE